MKQPLSVQRSTYVMTGFLGLLLHTSPLLADEIQVDSKISDVTVYPDSAMIKRLAKVSVPAGSNTLLIKNLPIGLMESSLRVNGDATVNVELGSVELQQEINKDVVNQAEKKLRDEIQQLTDSKQVLLDRLQMNKDQLEYIRAMALNNTGGDKISSYQQLPLDQWTTAWQTMAASTAEAQKGIRETEKEIREIDQKIKQRQQQLKQVATHRKSTRTAVLNINSDQSTELQLQLRYQIRGARWNPVYDADLDTKSAKVELKSLAQITQRTGEDWKDVNVMLSTLRPSAGTQLPQLNPWVIDYMPEIRPQMRMNKSMGGMAPMAEMAADSIDSAQEVMMMAAPAPAPMVKKRAIQATNSAVIVSDFSAEYEVPNKVSLSSGSDKRRVTLQTQKLDAAVKLASVPRIDPRAMLLASMEYHAETPLLPGTVTLHRDGNFIGNSFLKMYQPGEEIDLSFGEDDKVKIKFIPDPDQKGKDGILFGKRKTVTRNYHFTVTNQHDKAYQIDLSDNIPVAANEEIKVTLKGDKPTHIDDEDKKGIVVWQRKLAPSKTTKLEYGYEVTYPEDKHIMGL